MSKPNNKYHKTIAPQASQPATDKAWLGAAWKVAAFGCYALLNGIARYISGGGQEHVLPFQALPVYQIVFFQDLFALLILVPFYFKFFQWSQMKHLPAHAFRGVTSAVAVITWYFALFYLPLADAVALSVIGPIIGVLLAKFILKERLSATRMLFISISAIAAFYVMNTFNAFSQQTDNIIGIGFVFVSAICFALAKVSTRYLANQGCGARFLTLSLLLFVVPVSVVPALGHWVPLEWQHIPWLFAAGVLTVLAIMCVSKALVYSEISFLAPFDICRFLLNALVGYFAFTELPTASALAIVALFLVIISWRFRQERTSH